MKEYLVKNRIEEAKEEFLTQCKWSPNTAPRVGFKVALIKHEELIVSMTCYAPVERAVNMEDYSSVHEDSCLEFFFSPNGEKYINIEVNANCAKKISIGKDRYDRVPLCEVVQTMPSVTTKVEEKQWTATMIIPIKTIEESFEESIDNINIIYANFYSCADMASKPYYTAWNRVDTEKPDYHQSKYFGKLII